MKEILKIKIQNKSYQQFYSCAVTAGFPSPADDYLESKLDLNDYLIKHPSATFFVRVVGDSMVNAGIHNNDIIIVDRSIKPKHGKIIVLHGDQYDAVTSNAKWISKLGGILYDALIVINRPLSKYLKNLTKKIVSSLSGFQQLVKKECQDGGYRGLICGHNHRPEILKFKTHYYLNTGDWVESCSAIVEESDGTIKLIKIEEDLKITSLSEL